MVLEDLLFYAVPTGMERHFKSIERNCTYTVKSEMRGFICYEDAICSFGAYILINVSVLRILFHDYAGIFFFFWFF